jgi:hypothetical protein
MRRMSIVVMSVFLLGFVSDKSATQQYCYRPLCGDDASCHPTDMYSIGFAAGPCCCNVSCSPSGCSCANTCWKSCSGGATACQGVDCAKGICPSGPSAPLRVQPGQAAGTSNVVSPATNVEDAYEMSREEHAALEAENPVVGVVLGAIGGKAADTLRFHSGPFSGSRKNIDAQGAPTSAYRFYGNVLTASSGELVIDIAYREVVRRDIPYSAAPSQVRVTAGLGQHLRVLPLSPEQRADLDALFTGLGNPQAIRPR